jgi:hypothetical protein
MGGEMSKKTKAVAKRKSPKGMSKSTLQRRKQAQKGYIKFSNPRMEKFVSGLASGKGVVEAGLAAGYKENYCRTRLYAQMKTSNSFKELVKRHAKHSVELITNLYKINLLPRTFDADEAMLQKIEEKPELGMKYPQVINRIHKVAGITEEVPAVQFVSIQTLNQLQVMQNEALSGLIDNKHDDDDIIEVSDD